jgi:endonuclease YncB( thermonuclease family)
MLRAGLATVYEAKSGVEFGEGLEKKYRSAEWWAKTKRKGMWASKSKDYESPREYKTRYTSGSPQEENKS